MFENTVKATEISDVAVCKTHCDWIISKVRMLKALISRDTEGIAQKNRIKATSAIETIESSFNELKHYIVENFAVEQTLPSNAKATKAPIMANLLVTIGSRAAYMDSKGYITLPEYSAGEDILANFAYALAGNYLAEEPDMSFDEYIETALANRFPKVEDDV